MALFSFWACKRVDQSDKKQEKPCDIELTSSEQITPNSQYLAQAVLWYQKSAELRALYLQAFNLAKLQLQKFTGEGNKKPAVVLDIDETVLDNSPYEGYRILNDKEYERETWNAWVEKESAYATPGALDFVNYAKELGVEVFYISNRTIDLLESTVNNLKELKFPNADEKFILLKENDSSKESRRLKVSENYNIVMLIGDNLIDFHQVFENRGDDHAYALVDSMRQEFGSKFIILPNPMYGSWEKDIYGDMDTDAAQKDSIRKCFLNSFRP